MKKLLLLLLISLGFMGLAYGNTEEEDKEKDFIEAAIQKELEDAIALEATKEKELVDALTTEKNKQKEIVEAQAALAKQLSFSSDTFCDQSPNVKESDGRFYFQNQDKPYSGKNLCVYKNDNHYSQGDIYKGLRDGKWTYSYQNGMKKSEIQYVDGERHGTRTDWYEQGQIKSTAIYKAGKQHGSQVAWHPNGRKMAETIFVNDKEDGDLIAWHDNGQIQLRSYFKDGKEDGEFSLYDELGNKLVEGQYIDGEKDGTWKEWIVRGDKVEPKTTVTYVNGVKNGLEINYFIESSYEDCSYGHKQSQGYYKNGKKDGPWKEWTEYGRVRVTYPDGSFMYWACPENQRLSTEGMYKNGMKSGEWKEGDLKGSYVNGKKHNIWTEHNGIYVIATYSYNFGVKDGLFTTYTRYGFGNKKLSEGRYKNGKKNGIWTIWFKGESQKKSKTNYKNGEKNGVEIEWGMGDDLYGYKIHQTNYKNGRKDGLYIKYFTNYDNNKEIKGYYQLGKKHGIWLEYHWDGELSRAQCYQNDEKTKLISCQNSELELEWQVEVTTQAGESKLKGEFKARQEAEARMAEAEARAQEAESLAQDAGKEAVLDDKENEKKAFQIYTDGRNDFIFGNYDKAIVLFKGYLDSFPNSKNVADAKLWLGRSYFVNELYSESKTIYLEFQSENPQHDKYPDSIYELSHVFFELGELDAAKKMLKKLIGKFPSHHLNKKAKQMLTKLENS